MSFEIQEQALVSGLALIRDRNSNATSESNVNTGAGTIYLGKIVNNSSQSSYTCIYNNTAPTIGTTAPDIVFYTRSGKTKQIAVVNGIALGTGVSVCTKTAGGTTGTTDPDNTVDLSLAVA